jgi:hypothetical protein
MLFKEFQATGEDCADIGTAIGEEMLIGATGRVYMGKLYIEKYATQWHLCIANCDAVGELADLEAQLYDWALSEGYLDDAIESLADEALNAACLLIQQRVGQDAGDLAGAFFSCDTVRKAFEQYIKLELKPTY